ncbi:MAG: hypothetical protein LBP53_07190 [Candidatus Peribacteria bacterium]|nr:hypothetical protein [Candidatus Peribacteria bacterium]
MILNRQPLPRFKIPEKKEILIELFVNNQLIDIFSVEQFRVKSADDRMMSFQKVILPDKILTTNVDTVENRINIKSPRLANPGMLLTTNDDDFVDCAVPKPETPIVPLPSELCTDAQDELLTLTEIFRGNDTYDPYLEFLIHEDMEDDYDFLIFSGSLLQTSLTLDLFDKTESYDRDNLQKNTRLIVANNVGNLSEA